MIYKSLLALILFVLANACSFAATNAAARWQLDVKAGAYQPAAEKWAQYYGSRYTKSGGATVRYAVFPFLRLGVSGQYIRSSGKGDLLTNQTKGGEVLLEYLPVSASLGLFGRFWPGQWLVPYVEVGSGVLPYSQYVSHQSTSRGWTRLSEGKAGLQLVLDWMDKAASQNLLTDYGVAHSFLFVEYAEIRAEKSGIDLGGRTLMIGLGMDIQ